MEEETLWQLERAFWLEGDAFYRRTLDPEALMIFPEPAGMMCGEAAIAALAGKPRWQRVEMNERRALALARNAVALAYRASASRGDGHSYQALCSSTYRRKGDKWLLCIHQQTPSD